MRQNTKALYDPEQDVIQEVPWNFAKFILDGSTGQVVSYYIPRIAPLTLRREIESLCAKGDPYVPNPNPPQFGGLYDGTALP